MYGAAPLFEKYPEIICSPIFLDTQVSLAPTPVSPFCQHLWALTKRRDDIVVADMVPDMVADMELDMVADIEVDKVANVVANKEEKKKRDRRGVELGGWHRHRHQRGNLI